MKNIFQRITAEKTSTSNTQPVLRELNENEMLQVAGGRDMDHRHHHHHHHHHDHDAKKKRP